MYRSDRDFTLQQILDNIMSDNTVPTNASSESPSVLFFGVGSVGAIYLYVLSRVCAPTAVCRSNYNIIRDQGFTINSSIFGKNVTVKPKVVRTCEEAVAQQSAPFDYLIVTSKATLNTIPNAIKPAVTPGHTVIVLIQNGIGIEEEYALAFPDNPIVSAAVYCKAIQRPAGIITHDEIERLELGAYPSSAPSIYATAFTSLMKSAGATVIFYTDVQYLRWYKLLMNVSWNPICALTLSTDVGFLTSSVDATQFVLDVMLEARDIAHAYGYDISMEAVDKQLGMAKARIERGNAVEPSMLQDVKEGRRLEVEPILGNAVRMGREKGVVCAKLEVLYLLIKALDLQMGK
jgi:2-dehydropantoate 2-reductase